MIVNGRGFILDEPRTYEEMRAEQVAKRLLGPHSGTWFGMGIRRSDDEADRLVWAPEGEFDFITMPSPIARITDGPFGVVIQCVDGIYLLRTDTVPQEVNQWRVEKIR